MLLDIKGANFKVYIYLGPNVRLPKQSEPTYEWGCPNGVFDQYRQGVVSGTIKLSDIGDTEVDATGPLVYLVQESVIGGDSGSAVYSQVDGQLIGIVTYGFDSGQFMGMFPIQFTGEQIEASMQ
jgi:S1-C subfamily serine protease